MVMTLSYEDIAGKSYSSRFLMEAKFGGQTAPSKERPVSDGFGYIEYRAM
jgi:hypothetical protein